MKASTLYYLAGALALSAFLAASSAAHASCTGSNRIGAHNSSCFSETHGKSCASRSIFGTCDSYNSSGTATLTCSLGQDEKTVIKVDVAHRADRTLTFNEHNSVNDQRRYTLRNSHGYVRGLYCCKDLGKCN